VRQVLLPHVVSRSLLTSRGDASTNNPVFASRKGGRLTDQVHAGSRGSTDRSRKLIAMVGTVALVTPPVRVGQHLLAYRLATALGLDAV
jgi:hypothetical protein